MPRRSAVPVLTLGALALFACGTVLSIDPDDPVTPARDGGTDGPVEDGGTVPDACATCPQLLTKGYGDVRHLAVDDDSVYFTSYDRWLVGRVAKDGGPGTELVPEGGLKIPSSGLVVDGRSLYVSAYTPGGGTTGVRRIAEDGGVEVIDKCNTAWSVVVDATNIYWLTGDCGNPARMKRTGKDERDAAAVVSSSTYGLDEYGYGLWGDTVSDSTDLFWMSTERIDKLPKAYGPLTTPATIFDQTDGGTNEQLRGLAIGDRLYAVFGDRVIALNKSGGAFTVVVDALPNGVKTRAGIVVDGDRIYFTRPEAGIVARVSTAGGQIETLASGQAKPTGLALDADYIYWSNAGDGTIWRIAR